MADQQQQLHRTCPNCRCEATAYEPAGTEEHGDYPGQASADYPDVLTFRCGRVEVDEGADVHDSDACEVIRSLRVELAQTKAAASICDDLIERLTASLPQATEHGLQPTADEPGPCETCGHGPDGHRLEGDCSCAWIHCDCKHYAWDPMAREGRLSS